ncbi:hypothetical protein ACFY30_28875 [Streptomyces sp. NPDC000345]|uniref:hypothetical protein n=1 Tax=Streptomyces sp. NPDC000345 TaxID=3364537 RepID=UPI0036C8B715
MRAHHRCGAAGAAVAVREGHGGDRRRARARRRPDARRRRAGGHRNALAHPGDTLGRTASPHQILAPRAGPLIAVRLNALTRDGDMIDRRR